MPLTLAFVTLFPEFISGWGSHSIIGRAVREGKLQIRTANPRDFCYDRHQKVDDTPFGGEPGMLIKPEPVALAIEHLNLTGGIVVATDPTGVVFSQSLAVELARASSVTFLCGHYEGIDERVVERFATHRVSIGDYILSGGELPALVMADAIARYVPTVLGSAESLAADAFSEGILSAPNYTRPVDWRGEEVPAVLRSGDHRAIAEWRKREAIRLTLERRPALMETRPGDLA